MSPLNSNTTYLQIKIIFNPPLCRSNKYRNIEHTSDPQRKLSPEKPVRTRRKSKTSHYPARSLTATERTFPNQAKQDLPTPPETHIRLFHSATNRARKSHAQRTLMINHSERKRANRRRYLRPGIFLPRHNKRNTFSYPKRGIVSSSRMAEAA